jgi:hypothetical protein
MTYAYVLLGIISATKFLDNVFRAIDIVCFSTVVTATLFLIPYVSFNWVRKNLKVKKEGQRILASNMGRTLKDHVVCPPNCTLCHTSYGINLDLCPYRLEVFGA